MYEWLRPGGKVFLQVGTVYAGHIKRLFGWRTYEGFICVSLWDRVGAVLLGLRVHDSYVTTTSGPRTPRATKEA
jgi:hypothetical protein